MNPPPNHSNSAADLLAWWNAAPRYYAWDLVERLLQMTGDKELFQQSLNITEFGDLPDQREKAWAEILREICADKNVAEFREISKRKRIGEWLKAAFEYQGLSDEQRPRFEALVAFSMARATDLHFGNQLFGPIRERFHDSTKPVVAGQLIPLRRDGYLVTMLKNDKKLLTPKSISLSDDPQVLWHCRLAPVRAPDDPQLVICSAHYDAISRALKSDGRPLVFAVGLLAWGEEQRCDKLSESSQNFIVRQFPEPKDEPKVKPKDFKTRLQRILEKAIELKVDVLVLPELCASPDAQRTLLKLFASIHNAGKGHAVRLLVAGSVHEHVGNENGERSRQQNVTRLALGSNSILRIEPREVAHFKFQNYKGPAIDRTGQSFRGTELLNPKPIRSITCYVGDQVSFVTLCCKDFLEPSVFDLLTVAQPSHVFVPALTASIDTFIANANFIATNAQSRVIVANGLVPWDSAELGTSADAKPAKNLALFAFPAQELARNGTTVLDRELVPQKFPLPALCTWEDGRKTCTWVSA